MPGESKKNQSLHMVMITAFFLPKIGGSEKQLFTLARALHKQGIAITIITRQYDPILMNHEHVNGIEILRFSFMNMPMMDLITFNLKLFFWLIKHRNVYTVIYANLASSHAVTAALIGLCCKKKVFIKLGGSGRYGDLMTSRHSLLGKIKINLLRNSTARYIAVSSEIVEELRAYKFPEQSISLIPNGVNSELFYPISDQKKKEIRTRLDLVHDAILFIFAGRFDLSKNIITMLIAWHKLGDQKNHMKLLIIGEGPLEQNIRQVITTKQLQNSIVLKPFQDNIQEYFQASDSMIALSVSEGLSNTILEGMACGLPVIGSRARGIEEIITDGYNGFTVDPDKITRVTETIRKLGSDKHLRKKMSEKASQTIKEHYRIDHTVQRILPLISS
ncbi:MAG: glycosyltransferase [Elusimicrobia bacterium]|nr:glycosyltransferase [Elusimicrobiota bacterium]MBD3411717.1 glycosyltransferase [Elusimicrobiota bacterium]